LPKNRTSNRARRFDNQKRYRISKSKRAKSHLKKLVRLEQQITAYEDEIAGLQEVWPGLDQDARLWAKTRDRIHWLRGERAKAAASYKRKTNWLRRNWKKVQAAWLRRVRKDGEWILETDPEIAAAIEKLGLEIPKAVSKAFRCEHKYPTGRTCPRQKKNRLVKYCEFHQRFHDAINRRTERRKEVKSNAEWETRDWKHKSEKQMKKRISTESKVGHE